MWKQVYNYEGLYEVSDTGEVLSVRQNKIMGTPRTDGYPQVALIKGGTRKSYAVHKLVLEAFVGLAPEGTECAHGNGVRDDNGIKNLRWATRSEQYADRVLHGTGNGSENFYGAKLDWPAVRKIRASADSQRKLAKRHGVSQGCIQKIMSGKTWTEGA